MKIPKSQLLWVTYRDIKGAVRYRVTSDETRRKYTLWSISGDDAEKVDTSTCPADFDDIVTEGLAIH